MKDEDAFKIKKYFLKEKPVKLLKIKIGFKKVEREHIFQVFGPLFEQLVLFIMNL